MQTDLTVNDKPVRLDLPANTLLVSALRDSLGLTGTHVGCDTAQCGACTVLLDGRPVKACNVLVAQVSGRAITTIEGLAQADAPLHPMQAAFRDCHGLQCGFCTPGMVLAAVALCRQHPQASASQVAELLEGNICRCTGYQNIVHAVVQGRAVMARA